MAPLLPLAAGLLLAVVERIFSRQEAATLVDEKLLPKADYGKRICLGKTILGGDNNKVVLKDDPLTAFTYGEFPLSSLDTLLDKALEHVDPTPRNEPMRVIDLGSGCARLCFYLALSRPSWEVHGIEALGVLHEESKRAEQVGLENGWFQSVNSSSEAVPSSLCLHHGLAEEFSAVFQNAHLIFMYSTAMESQTFLPEVGAMILSRYWNELLTNHCQRGCVVVTTDRALDPAYGWKLLDRFDVPNPEVFGSTGFIQIKNV
jgi:hypothetical protein